MFSGLVLSRKTQIYFIRFCITICDWAFFYVCVFGTWALANVNNEFNYFTHQFKVLTEKIPNSDFLKLDIHGLIPFGAIHKICTQLNSKEWSHYESILVPTVGGGFKPEEYIRIFDCIFSIFEIFFDKKEKLKTEVSLALNLNSRIFNTKLLWELNKAIDITYILWFWHCSF